MIFTAFCIFSFLTVVYCDYTASGRALRFIEDYIQEQVLPTYGNVHTTTTVTSLQSTLYRHEARDIFRNAVNASEHDAVIFVGSGCTGAVHKLINALQLNTPPIVFVGPFEHHSSILPWKDLGARVIRIPQDRSGGVNMAVLEDQLKQHANRGVQLIGCFSAASNITGTSCDVDSITITLHRHGALAFWDYATAGPYVEVNMNPVVGGKDQEHVHKDAIFLSPHKFVGGVETPGLLIAKKILFRNAAPTGAGGGSVFFVSRQNHRYLKQVEMREEGGTPSIVGAIRAGLAMQLKEAVGSDFIMEKEKMICRKVMEKWSSVPNLVLLGSLELTRLPIFSFVIRHPSTNQFLHHNFVCAVLNDVFGIQARGGCACAGPYAQDVLGIDENLAQDYEKLLLEDDRLDRVHLRRYHEYSEREVLRPGFIRLNFPFFMKDDCVDFVIDAVTMVAEYGWRLLPKYIFNPETSEWKQRHHQVFQDRRWLGSISYREGHMIVASPVNVKSKGPLPKSYIECLDAAKRIFMNPSLKSIKLPDQTVLFDETSAPLRWFVLPSEALVLLQNHEAVPQVMPFSPPSFPLPLSYTTPTIIEGALHDCSSERIGNEIPSNEKMLENTVCNVGLVDNGDEVQESNGVISRKKTAQDLSNTKICKEKDMSRLQNKSAVHSGNHTSLSDHLPIDGSGSKGIELGESNLVNRSECLNSLGSSTIDSIRLNEANHLMKAFDDHVNSQNSQNTPSQDTHPENQYMTPVLSEVMELEAKTSLCEMRNRKTATPIENGIHLNSAEDELHQETVPNICENRDRNIEKNSVTAITISAKKEKTNEIRFQVPPKKIFKPTVQALEEYSMLCNEDRVLICLSGGKDSLSLLHTIRQYQFYAKNKGINFEFGAVTVDPQTPSFDPSPLKQYLVKLGVPYFYEEQGIIDQAASLPGGCDSICSFCSRMKRGRIYHCARREGYNVLAMGQHLDDLAESFLMSTFHNGFLRTIKANYTVREGDLRVIRPFVYVREKDLRDFAQKAKLPVIPENCPACFEAPKERHRTKQLLAAQELLFPNLYQSLMSALKPLMAVDRTGMESRRKDEESDEVLL